METFSALLAICAVNSPVPAQKPVTRSFDVLFDLRLNKRLSEQSWGWRFETPSRPLWRHFNVNWHACGYNTTHPNKIGFSRQFMPYISLELVFILLFGYANRHSGYLITPDAHIYWKTHNVYECISKMFARGETTMFHHFHIFYHKQQKHEATGLSGPGYALTYVNKYKSHTHTHTHIYIYIHIYIYTHTHIYIYITHIL